MEQTHLWKKKWKYNKKCSHQDHKSTSSAFIIRKCIILILRGLLISHPDLWMKIWGQESDKSVGVRSHIRGSWVVGWPETKLNIQIPKPYRLNRNLSRAGPYHLFSQLHRWFWYTPKFKNPTSFQIFSLKMMFPRPLSFSSSN